MSYRKTFFLVLLSMSVLPLSHNVALAGGLTHSSPHASVFHAPPQERSGNRVTTTQKRYQPVKVGKQTYYYRDGLFFNLQRGRYITIDPPRGARVSSLPQSAVRLEIGPSRYFRIGLNWYLFRGENDYEVVDAPRDNNGQIAEIEESEYERQRVELAVYPSEGQSENQLDRDRYECHLWASDQSGFDPTLSNQDPDQRDFYSRAISACLEGRGYTVN